MLAEPRRATGFIALVVQDRAVGIYESAIPVDEEAWLLLKAYSEVNERGCAFIREHQPALGSHDAELVWRDFRAYVRQAETFYRAAAPLPWKSAPLNYYYSFLNLAKALLVARGLLPTTKVRHGLSAESPQPESRLPEWHVVVRNGVFRLLVQQQLHLALAVGFRLSISQLLAYARPVGFQYAESRLAMPRVHGCHLAHMADSSHARLCVAIPNAAAVTEHPALGPALLQIIREVRRPKKLAHEMFGLNAYQSNHFQFFESSEPVALQNPDFSPFALVSQFRSSVAGAVQPPIASTQEQFLLTVPCQHSEAIWL